MVQSCLRLVSLEEREKAKQAKRAREAQSGIFIIKIFPAVCSFTSTGTSSFVSYTPMTELDYGTLLCSATNKIGKQKHPCIFHIIAAGRFRWFSPALCVMKAQKAPEHLSLRVGLGLNIINDAPRGIIFDGE